MSPEPRLGDPDWQPPPPAAPTPIVVPPKSSTVTIEPAPTPDDRFDDRVRAIASASLAVFLILLIGLLAFWGPDNDLAKGALATLGPSLGWASKHFYDNARSGGP